MKLPVDDAANLEAYCKVWRQFFLQVANWDARQTEELIESLKTMSASLIFHEEPATWAVWAALPHREGISAQRVEQARNKLINFIIAQKYSRGGSDDSIDWRIIGHAYRDLLNELEQPNPN